MHRVHAPDARPPSVILSSAEAHHVTHVLRLGAGDEVAVFNGRGQEWLGRIASVARSAVLVDLVAARPSLTEPAVFVTMAIALLKGGQMDDVIRDVTMLGASAVAPFVSSHVAVPEEGRQTRSVERWARVAVASAKQSGRAVVPIVRPIVTLEDVLDEHRADLLVLCVEPRRGQTNRDEDLHRPDRAVVLVGPEGGWAESEVDLVRRAGARVLNLGPWTLRAEVAPVVALATLWSRWCVEGQTAEGKGQK